MDEELLKALSFTAGGLLPPLATAVGGLAAQEALIALTGKFSPLKQWVRENVFFVAVFTSIAHVLYLCSCIWTQWKCCKIKRALIQHHSYQSECLCVSNIVGHCLYTSLRGDRYDAVRICLGEELLQKMANCRLFMVITVLIRFKATLKNNYVLQK